MAYALSLKWSRCPDGVAWSGSILGGTTEFRCLSSKRETVTGHLKLKQPVALDFIKAVTDDEMAAFITEYGWPIPDLEKEKIEREVGRGPGNPWFALAGSMKREAVSAKAVRAAQQKIRNAVLAAGNSEDPHRAAQSLNHALQQWAHVKPSLYRPSQTDELRLRLEVPSLYGFMLMEAAIIALPGTELMACERCGAFYLIGEETGQQPHRRYCSDRCRVAAMRSRQKSAEVEKPRARARKGRGGR